MFSDWNKAFAKLISDSSEFDCPSCYVYSSCSSTMDLGAKYLNTQDFCKENEIRHSDANSSVWFFSLEQTSGRGRRNRSWESGNSGGMYFTLVDTNQRKLNQLSGLSLAIGLAIQQKLKDLGLKAGLKWPNDILTLAHPHLKVSGILIETKPVKNTSFCNVLVGVGVNINQSSFDKSVPATSLRLQIGTHVNYEETCLLIAKEIESTYQDFFHNGFIHFKDKWWDASLMKESRVKCENPQIEGIVTGVDDTGALLVRSEDKTHKIISGDVGLEYEFLKKQH